MRENKYPVNRLIQPQNVLASVYDKSGLEVIVKGLLKINPGVKFYSTGGTGRKLIEILGEDSKNYVSVEEFTGAPEMEGGLVKTLHPKIHAGLLGERGNPEHERYLHEVMSNGVYFDVMIGNLYPFTKAEDEPEDKRINIDIGGPTMVMAGAKNWHSVAVLTSPSQYRNFINKVKEDDGITVKQRFELAQQAMKVIGQYRLSISLYFNNLDFKEEVKPFLNIK